MLGTARLGPCQGPHCSSADALVDDGYSGAKLAPGRKIQRLRSLDQGNVYAVFDNLDDRLVLGQQSPLADGRSDTGEGHAQGVAQSLIFAQGGLQVCFAWA